MGIKIADLTEGRERASTTKDLATEVLKKKALGIGEHHDQDDGRELAGRLLATTITEGDNLVNLVRHFFIEIPAWGQQSVTEAARLANGPQSLEIRKGFVATQLEAGFSGGGVTNKESLKKVVSIALFAGINVYCADLNPGTYASVIMKRNEFIAQKVREVAKADFSRCLLLFGSDHFDGAQSKTSHKTLSELIDQLDWVKCGPPIPRGQGLDDFDKY